jgi:hypothetical protein
MGTLDQIEELGQRAADAVAGAGVFPRVRVASDSDNESRPVYRFSFLIDVQKAAPEHLGLIRIRLIQRLYDDLAAQNDEHLPQIRLLNKADWEEEARARPH